MPPEENIIKSEDEYTGKSVVIKTSLKQTVFLHHPGLVDVDKLKPGENVGVKKDSFLIMEPLPSEFDSRAQAMEVD